MRYFAIFFVLMTVIWGCGPNLEKSDRLVDEGIMQAYYAQYQEAIETYTEAIRNNPENFEAYYYRGNAKASLRRYKEAIEDFTHAIEIHPRYADAFANRGQMKFYLNDNEGACDDWKAAESLGKANMSDKTRFCK